MRVPALTGVRGVAAVAVLLYHIPQQPIFRPYTLPFMTRGYLCVDLFFVLSGFVIAIGYQRRVTGRLSARSYGDFLINRLARVFPLHLVVTLAFALRGLLNVSGDGGLPLNGRDLGANLLMIQSWGLGTHALAGNSWSVSTELVAYLLFPLIALWSLSRGAALLAITAAALTTLVAFSGLGVEGPMDVVQRDSFLPILRCLGEFSLGVLSYRIADRPRVRSMLAGDGAFAATCVAIAAAFMVPRGDLLVALLWPLMVLCCYYNGRLVRAVLANRLVMHLGIISYSIYLWHPLFRDMAARGLGVAHAHGVVSIDFLFIIGMIAAIWLGSWISYRLVEVRGHHLLKGIFARIEHRHLTPGGGPAGHSN